MSALLWELIALHYAPLGAYGALVEGSTARAMRSAAAQDVLVA